jgi:hypothetical protein
VKQASPTASNSALTPITILQTVASAAISVRLVRAALMANVLVALLVKRAARELAVRPDRLAVMMHVPP